MKSGAVQVQTFQRLATAIGILVAAYFLRLLFLDRQSLWIDEAFAVSRAQLSPWLAALGDEGHPPLYFLALWLWVRLAGISEFSVRYLSLLTSVLSVAIAIRIGLERRPRVAWLTGTLLAVSGLAVFYAQEARMYAPAAMLALASAYSGWRLQAGGSQCYMRLHVITTTFLLYTQFLGWLIWCTQLAFGLVFWRRSAGRRPWLIAQRRIFLYSIFVLPFLARLLLTSGGRSSGAPPGLAGLAALPARFLFGPAPPDLLIWLGGLGFLGILGWSVVHLVRARWFGQEVRTIVYWGFLSLAGPGATWIAGLARIDLFQIRYLSLYAAPFLIALGSLIGSLPRFARQVWLMALLVLTAFALNALYNDPAERRDDWRALVQRIERASNSADLIVLDQGWSVHALAYYFHGRTKYLGVPIDIDPHTLVFPPQPVAQAPWQEILRSEAATHDRIWLIRYLPIAFPTLAAAEEHFGRLGFRLVMIETWSSIELSQFVR